ncbi:MAG: TOBE domain-containing protein, partial [Alphaproteobacteria bacterium]|nr:TOBE domain-containing protein [Alphaproteobacteria bacterium]
GRILQVGSPAAVYEYPSNRFVAEFIGAVNIFEGRVVESLGDNVLVHCDDNACELLIHHAHPLESGAAVAVAVRPEKITVSETAPSESRNLVRGVVAEIGYLGGVSIYHVRLASGRIVKAQLTNLARLTTTPLAWGQEVYLSWQPSSGLVLTS